MNYKELSLIIVAALLGTFGAYQVAKTSNKTSSSLEDYRNYVNLSRDQLQYRLALFKDWMVKFDRNYGVSEGPYKFKVWNDNYDIIQEHNAKNLSWTYGLNQFSDLTPEEFSALHLGFNAAQDVNREANEKYLDEVDAPSSIDWRKKGAVTSMKNQRTCGCCYAFSAIAGLEGLLYNTKGELENLSNQQIAACSRAQGNNGCNGGLMTNSYEYTKSNGISKASRYPYIENADSCDKSKIKSYFTHRGYTNVPANNYLQLINAVAQQPVPVGVQASGALQNYQGGIITSTSCGTALDHAITIVGYNQQEKYWIVKNQWAKTWGEQGYVRIALGDQNYGKGICGINMMATYPTA